MATYGLSRWVRPLSSSTIPRSIYFHTTHVQTKRSGETNGGSSYDVEGEGKEVLADIISQQEQRAFLQEDNAKRVEESAERQFPEQKRVQIHLREEVRNAPRVEGKAVEC